MEPPTNYFLQSKSLKIIHHSRSGSVSVRSNLILCLKSSERKLSQKRRKLENDKCLSWTTPLPTRSSRRTTWAVVKLRTATDCNGLQRSWMMAPTHALEVFGNAAFRCALLPSFHHTSAAMCWTRIPTESSDIWITSWLIRLIPGISSWNSEVSGLRLKTTRTEYSEIQPWWIRIDFLVNTSFDYRI